MTNKEALARINILSTNPFESDGNIEAFKLSAEALEKQIPKKPNHTPYYAYCPSCRGILYVGDYCPACGQKLDWDNDKEWRVNND